MGTDGRESVGLRANMDVEEWGWVGVGRDGWGWVGTSGDD